MQAGTRKPMFFSSWMVRKFMQIILQRSPIIFEEMIAQVDGGLFSMWFIVLRQCFNSETCYCDHILHLKVKHVNVNSFWVQSIVPSAINRYYQLLLLSDLNKLCYKKTLSWLLRYKELFRPRTFQRRLVLVTSSTTT